MRKCKHLLCMQMKTKVLSVNELLYACKYVPICLVPKIKEKEFHSAAGMNRVRQHKTQTSACLFHVHHKCPGFPSKDGWARVRHSAPLSCMSIYWADFAPPVLIRSTHGAGFAPSLSTTADLPPSPVHPPTMCIYVFG